MDHELHMRAALELAKQAAAGGDVPVGCVITDRESKVIGTGYNRREADSSAVAHAEVEAITAACKKAGSWRLEGCTLYVTLEPCPMCMGAILHARIPRVVFGAKDPRAGACGSLLRLSDYPFESDPTVESGFLEEESLALLQEFFAERRKKKQ